MVWNELLDKSTLLRKKDQTVPFVAAGCLVQMPFHMANFSFPWGGFGSVLNRNAIQRLIQPIYCNATTSTADPHTQRVCQHVEENLAAMAFEDGMSVSDLMDRSTRCAVAVTHLFGYWREKMR